MELVNRKLTSGQIVGGTIAVLRVGWRGILVGALLFGLIEIAMTSGDEQGLLADLGFDLWGARQFGLLELLLMLVAYLLACGIPSVLVTAAMLDASLPDGVLSAQRRNPHWFRAYLAYLLTTLGIVAGLVMLVIPGLFLLTRWLPVLPAALYSDRPVRAVVGNAFQSTGATAGLITVFLIALFLVQMGITAIPADVAGTSSANEVLLELVALAISVGVHILGLALSVAVALGLMNQSAHAERVFG